MSGMNHSMPQGQGMHDPAAAAMMAPFNMA